VSHADYSRPGVEPWWEAYRPPPPPREEVAEEVTGRQIAEYAALAMWFGILFGMVFVMAIAPVVTR